MRVSIDARYLREKPSGIGVYVQALIERLPAMAPSDQFIFWAHKLARRPLSSAPNCRDVIVAPGPNSPWPLVWPDRYGSFEQVDVFHSPHNVLPRGMACATVVTVHDVMAIDRPDLHLGGLERLVKSLYYPQAIWRALRLATRIIVPSSATAERIGALLPAAAPRVRVIREAADPIFQPAPEPLVAAGRAARIVGSDAPYLLVVGANRRTKRHDLALKAFAAGVPAPWRLVVLHRQGGHHQLMQLARRLDIAERVVWLSRRQREDLVTLLQGAAALVQPSVYEGFGLPVLEAMACGCPVVCSDIPPFREITAGAALLVPAESVGALACALRRLASSPEQRSALSTQGLHRSRAFSWERSSAETLHVYREAAAA